MGPLALPIISLVGSVLDKIIPDPNAAAQAKLAQLFSPSDRMG